MIYKYRKECTVMKCMAIKQTCNLRPRMGPCHLWEQLKGRPIRSAHPSNTLELTILYRSYTAIHCTIDEIYCVVLSQSCDAYSNHPNWWLLGGLALALREASSNTIPL